MMLVLLVFKKWCLAVYIHEKKKKKKKAQMRHRRVGSRVGLRHNTSRVHAS